MSKRLPEFEGEALEPARDVSARDIFSLAAPQGSVLKAIRAQQLEVLVKLVPITVFTQALAAILLIFALWDNAPHIQLLVWGSVGIGICVWRGFRARRLRLDAEYRSRKPTSFTHVTRAICTIAFLWLVPPFLWFDAASADAQLYMTVLIAVLLSAGSITMVTVPPAALSYMLVMLVGAITITIKIDNIPMLLMSLIYAASLTWAITANARRFIGHARARLELQEKGEIIELLREFEAAGSGGLWELDHELRIVHVSKDLAGSLSRSPSETIGVHARQFLDPTGRIVNLSSGMRSLFESLEKGEEFKDVAIPSVDSQRWYSLSGKPMRDDRGRIVGWRGVGSDITELRLKGDDAVRTARTDPLTGIANRLLMRELLEEAIIGVSENGDDCAMLVVDLDRFKLVNDTLGHAIGDQLLCKVAARLVKTVGDGGTVGRLGGDEFAIIWTGPSDRAVLAGLALEIIADLSRTIEIGAADLHVGATVGIAIAPEDGVDEEGLMRSADLALYRAKNEGRGGYAFYEQAMFEKAEDMRLLEHDVRQALAQDALSLAYQPIVEAQGGRLVAREALLRWNHATRGAISPETFIPIIEDAGLIHRIGDWVIREACAEAAGWSDGARVAVNISAAQLTGAGLAKTVVSALATSGLEPSRLELEVTETIFLGDDAETLASLERLRALGVRLVIDDFGKGYSSFGYLARAHFSKIKIDSMFARGAAEGDRNCLAIVRAILALADGLGVETTAEGIEEEAQAAAMRDLGIDQLQGYLFGRPAFPEHSSVAPLAKRA
ncbi:putative bifunctional diguanylate cyclase/phosphodiesterase [Sphingomicrobium clamense]|uniref:EAL domain-containing protein n=1 Tax=Sphingomicrobium clamense TaxID=2851013 RepID=A0ABS6V723_9SPHN|nr:EAL domain-containing protein [Sphingomicrobium sp. B8]MBW0145362.1 EAL domain-containing protein [Sphingomicrobium sp. B8]